MSKDIKMGMQGWKQVSSQFIRAVKYNAIKRELSISFNDGGHETYHRVPPETYEGLMASDFKDEFHQKNILKEFFGTATPNR